MEAVFIAKINNTTSNTLISGTSDDDIINNGGLWDDDSRYSPFHDEGSNVAIDTGAGNDSVYNDTDDYITINTGVGDDYVENNGDSVMISGGKDNDFVSNFGSSVTISSGKGNDTILNVYNDDLTPDTIHLSGYGENVLFQYSSGDGDDKIYRFRADSTLSIGGDSYSMTKSGKNIVVTVGDGKISLIGAASLSSVNIVGEETQVETNTWTFDGTTAIYESSYKTAGYTLAKLHTHGRRRKNQSWWRGKRFKRSTRLAH